MQSVIKIALTAIICILLYVIVKSVKSEYAVFIEICGIAVVATLSIEYLTQALGAVSSMLDFPGIDSEYIKILIKALGIAVVTQTVGDICRDNSNSALASGVELSGRIIITAISLPIIKALAQLALGLIGA